MDPQPIVSGNQVPKSARGSKMIFILVLAGLISAFAAGYFLNSLLKAEHSPQIGGTSLPAQPLASTGSTTSGQPRIQDNSGGFQEANNFVAGKKYFEDSIMMVTKEAPYITIIATVTRQEQDSGYTQNTRVSFYDGNSWTRKAATDSTSDSNVKSNGIVSAWSSAIDSSRVLKESLNGQIMVDGHEIKLSTGVLQNEISMRSLPGYTKFMSNGQGTLIVDNKQYSAYELATKIYSLNSADIQFYDQSFGLTTDWVAFWDNEGNFYHIDATDVTNPTQIYKPHKIGIFENSSQVVAKTFQISVDRDSATPPNNYTFNLGAPIGQILKLNLLNSINKVPGGGYKWFMGQVKGNITSADGKSLDGIGIVEYIHN